MNRLMRFFKHLFLFATILISAASLASCGTSVKISEKEHSIFIGETISLTAESTDEDALVLWKTSDKKVAVVRKGNVTGIGNGECYITAYDDRGAESSCKITVTSMNVTLSHSSKEVDLAKLSTFTLVADSEDHGEIKWTSSNPNLATVENGHVKCLDTGDVTITASRNGGKKECHVNIFDSSRGLDYYVMTQGKNADVCAHPGIWYYNPNTGDAVGKSIYQNNGFTSSITKLVSDGGVQYRYQPGGEDKTGLRVGDKYTISFDVALNIDGKVNYNNGSKSVSVTANNFTRITFSGKILEDSPFNFSIKKLTVPSSGSIDITVKNIEIGTAQADDYYVMSAGKNAVVSADPGVWYYWCNGTDTISSAIYQNKGFVANITSLDSDQGTQFRYQPGGKDGTMLTVGDKYKISLDVKLSVDGTINYNNGKSSVSVTANTNKNITFEGQVTADNPFNISVKKISIAQGSYITLTASNIKITNLETGGDSEDEGGYDLENGKNAVVVAHPGIWYLWPNGGDDAYGHFSSQGVLTTSITQLTSTDGVQFRYQPGGNDGTGLQVGDKYSVTFKVTMNVAGTVTGKSSATVKTPGEFVTYTYSNGIVSSDSPFNFSVKNIAIPASGSIDVIVKDIKFAKVYNDAMTVGNLATVRANPGRWYYNSKGSAVFDQIPRQNPETGEMSMTMANFMGDHFYFRYQPGGIDNTGCVVGSSYKLSFTIETNLSIAFSYGTNGAVTTNLTANTPTSFIYEGVVDSTEIFIIKLDKDLPTPIRAVVSNISIEKVG